MVERRSQVKSSPNQPDNKKQRELKEILGDFNNIAFKRSDNATMAQDTERLKDLLKELKTLEDDN